MTQITHYPKGGRCAACKHRDADCSWRDFESMQPLVAKDKSDEQLVIVKWTGFERTER